MDKVSYIIGVYIFQVFSLKEELLKPKDEMERHITNLVKQVLHSYHQASDQNYVFRMSNLSIVLRPFSSSWRVPLYLKFRL